jgi:hypothetical protein
VRDGLTERSDQVIIIRTENVIDEEDSVTVWWRASAFHATRRTLVEVGEEPIVRGRWMRSDDGARVSLAQAIVEMHPDDMFFLLRTDVLVQHATVADAGLPS